MDNCIHHWLVESPHPGLLGAVCKHCGATRTFPSWPEEKFMMVNRPRELIVAPIEGHGRMI